MQPSIAGGLQLSQQLFPRSMTGTGEIAEGECRPGPDNEALPQPHSNELTMSHHGAPFTFLEDVIPAHLRVSS